MTAPLDLLFNNYRPVSNLPFLSKVTERAVFAQTHQHMMSNSLYPSLQSAYRQNHSTEMALLKVRSGILMKMNSQNVVLLVLLDLSAAFDTVDHKILLSRLHSTFGITGKPLDWFASYLTDWQESAYIYLRCSIQLFSVKLWSSSGVLPWSPALYHLRI